MTREKSSFAKNDGFIGQVNVVLTTNKRNFLLPLHKIEILKMSLQ